MGIDEILLKIRTERYGRDVRQAIHDGIKQAYEDAIANGHSEMEISQARGSYTTLAERLIADFNNLNSDKISKGKVEASDLMQSVLDIIDKKIAKGSVTMADLTQEVKEALTGGSVAVVGENAVGTINLIDNAVTSRKITGVAEYSSNLFNKAIVQNANYSGTIGNKISFGSNANWRTDKVRYQVKQGDTVRFSHAFQNGYYIGVDDNDVVVQTASTKSTVQPVELVVSAGVTGFYSSTYKDYIDQQMITINQPLPTSYVPYGILTKTLDWLKVEPSNLSDSVKSLLNVPSKRNGEHWLVIGNSIAWQDGKPYAEGNIAKGWQTILSEDLGMTFDNRAISGSPMASGTANPGAGIEKLKEITDFSPYDGIIIAHQTNDFKLNVPKGVLSSIKDTAPKDTTTFIGAFEEGIEYIQNHNSDIPIVLETGIKRNNSGYDTESTNTVGLKQIDYVNALKDVANKYSTIIIDTYLESGINEQTLDTDTRDGLHPNDKGYIKMARVYTKELEMLG